MRFYDERGGALTPDLAYEGNSYLGCCKEGCTASSACSYGAQNAVFGQGVWGGRKASAQDSFWIGAYWRSLGDDAVMSRVVFTQGALHRAAVVHVDMRHADGEWALMASTSAAFEGENVVLIVQPSPPSPPQSPRPPYPPPRVPAPRSPPQFAPLGPVEPIRSNSWHWSVPAGYDVAVGGFSWYTNIFRLYHEDVQLDQQMGMGGTWMGGANIDFGSGCACDPNGWPSAIVGDPSYGCCESSGRCGHLFHNVEGGPGYWPSSQLPTTQPKLRSNIAVGCYVDYNGPPPFWKWDASVRPCDNLNTVVVSNRLVIPPDGFTFDRMGLVGVGYVRTPLGKVDAADDRNFWTMVLDSVTFSGPVAYWLPELFRERRPGSSTSIPDLGKRGVSMQLGSMGFEWNTVRALKAGSVYKLPRMAFPADGEGGRGVLMRNMRGYADADVYDILEAALEAGAPVNASQLMGEGQPTQYCNAGVRDARYNVDGSRSFKLGTHMTSREGAECVWSIDIDSNGEDRPGHVPQYRDADSSDLAPLPESDVNGALREYPWPFPARFSRTYDVLASPPSGGCLTSPGPSDATLYCVRTKSPSVLGYKWYKFTEQPVMQRMRLTAEQKAYMQRRIETLHASTPRLSQWIKERGARANGLAELEASLLVRPPAGMDVGYVPVAVYEGLDEPDGCLFAPPPSPSPPASPPPSPACPSAMSGVPSTCQLTLNRLNEACRCEYTWKEGCTLPSGVQLTCAPGSQ